MSNVARNSPVTIRCSARILLGAALLWSAGIVWAQSPAKLTVQADRPGPQISPMLYGIFFEEVNHAGDGGLYAELVRNRSFEDADTPDHWSLLTTGSAKGEMAVDTQQPISAKNPRTLRLTVAPGGEGRVGIANTGYWGIALQKDAVYELSLSARSGNGFAGPLTVTLEDGSGQRIYAQGEVAGLTGDWKTFKVELTANAADPKARLVIAATHPGTVWLDMVSLFPKETWKERPNGMRVDLAEMLVGLRPSFMRFPGGCWVEGQKLQFAQRWKTTIDELAERRTQLNLWGYLSTNGLGFHEYLQLCEDLGAEPLFVINCGIAHEENAPMGQMNEWVQDALDAIEYANGPVESTWGSLRAKAGHPAPFNLRYMEIGNENNFQGPAYQERYPLFYDAIKARYPTMILIANEQTTARPADIVDEHYYSSPEFFMANAHKYDAYDRKGPKIYVGEYAVTEGCGQGNLRAAIGEAAFMTGMERNADVVVMASYAPLFANVNYKRWNPDLINFDSSRVYGLPSYYVQKLFSENRGDVVLPTAVDVPPTAMAEPKPGTIGLGTWSTRAEFKDVKVMDDGATLLMADFSNGLNGWTSVRGQWIAKDGTLQQTSEETDRRILTGNLSKSSYTLSLKARKLGGNEGFLVMFHVQDESNWVWWNLGGWGNEKHGLEQSVAGAKSFVGDRVSGKIETGRWYDIRIEVQDRTVRCYLDNSLIHNVSLPHVAPLLPLYAVSSYVDATGEMILKVVNAAFIAQEVEIDLRGVQHVEPVANAIVLTSVNPTDENSLDAPTKVTPVTQIIDDAATTFRHTFPVQSVTILRLKAER